MRSSKSRRGATAGPDRRRRCSGAAAAAALWLVGGAAPSGAEPEAPPASPPTLEALMRGMAGASGVHAHFRERKQLALLAEPLESQGELWFAPPDRLVRITETPSPSRLAIDGERVVFHDVGGAEAIDLSSSPVAEQFVSNFVVLFNGDLDALRARYEPSFHAGGDGWRLELRPRDRPLASVIDRVELAGTGRAIERMELVESDGDRTTTWFDDVRTDVVFDAALLERIFAEGTAPNESR